MALKYIIDDLVEVPGPLRSEYVKAADGKFHLSLDGHPDTTRVAEFRSKNIALMQEKDALAAKLAPFAGLDAEAAKAAIAKVAAGDDAELVKLKLKLAEAESNAASATQKAAALVLRQGIGDPFLATGGRAEALDYMVGKAPFTVVDGALKPNDGAPPTVEEWLATQLDASAFAFHPSRGGGALGAKPDVVLSTRGNVRELVNPTPQELGAAGADIKAGKARVIYR